jgi:endonuclease/exonuclease/phosphatase (EEP) superfamily protein YafD
MLEPEPLCLLAIHPYPPMSEDRFQERNLVLRAVAAAATQRSADPIMLLGDLNASSFSPIFSEVVGLSGLRDSQLDFGLQRSWPTDHYLLRIPIDHCLTSPRVVVQQRWLGPHVGSDHLPVLVDFSIRPAE